MKPSTLVIILAISLAIVVAYLTLWPFLDGVLKDYTCSKYLNADDTPLPVEVYYDIPAQCINMTRLYPDEKVDLGDGSGYEYREYPELGMACVRYNYVERNWSHSEPFSFGCKGMFRGRYTIEEDHKLFEKFIHPELSPNRTEWLHSQNTSTMSEGDCINASVKLNTSSMPIGCMRLS